MKGKFLTLSGLLIPLGGRGAGRATLTYITDTGRRDVISAEETVPFTIGDVQPGPIELLVTGDDGEGNECSSYSPMTVDKDVTTLRLACNPIHREQRADHGGYAFVATVYTACGSGWRAGSAPAGAG